MFIQKLTLNTTLHKWSYELSDSSKHYIFKIKGKIQEYLIERYFISKNNHVIEAIDDMDELYYSKPENNVGSDNVFITPHIDGFLGWVPFMRCWRCIYCITNPNNTSNHFPLNDVEETIITLKPNNFVCHDFNRDLHWIKPGILVNNDESRIVLKLHFYDYALFVKKFSTIYKQLNIRYNAFARNKFLYSINPYKNITAYFLSFLINSITIIGGYTEYFIGIVNITIFYFIFNGVYKNKHVCYICLECMVVYLSVMQQLLGVVPFGTFWRDLLVYKIIALTYIYIYWRKMNNNFTFIVSNISLLILSLSIAANKGNINRNTHIYYQHLNEFSRYHSNQYNIYFHLITSSLCYIAIFGIIQKKLRYRPIHLPYLVCGLTWMINKYSIPDGDACGLSTVLITIYSIITKKYINKITYTRCVFIFMLGYYLQEFSHIIFDEATYLSSYSSDNNKVNKFFSHVFWLLSFEIRVLLNLIKI